MLPNAAPKPVRVFDAEYLRLVRQLPCCVCQHAGESQQSHTEAHHTTTRGAGGGDDTAAPFCRSHHRIWHLIGRKSFLRQYGIDPAVVAADLWRHYRLHGWVA